jgi:murein DD-endopeptidase MepM/ murein hydrolase activator NlpD
MKAFPTIFGLFILLTSFSAYTDQVILPQSFGPPYFYPANPADRVYKLPFEKGKSFTTLDGYCSEYNGSHHPDYAVDFNMPEGEPILATHGGRVTSMRKADTVCYLAGSLGNCVYVQHLDSIPDTSRISGWRYVTIKDSYLHVRNDVPVNLGDYVQQGQIIAYTGCTGGDAGGPHLHYETNQLGHQGECEGRLGYYFESIPTPFVECTIHGNGLSEEGDNLVSDNTLWTGINAPSSPLLQTQPLLQASPNPVRATAVLTCYLPSGGNARLEVLNIRGQKVSGLAQGTYVPETTVRAVWNTEQTPAGIYVCRLLTREKTLTLKLLLTK